MDRRHRWRKALLVLASGGCLWGGSCRDTVRETIFREALELISGQVESNIIDAVPVDDILGGILNPRLPG